MNNRDHFFVLQLDDCRYALYLSVVQRVVRMIEIAPLPKVRTSCSA